MKTLRNLLLTACTAVLLTPALTAEVVETGDSWCGTGHVTFEVSRARDAFQDRRLQRESPGGVPRPKNPTTYQDGQIAVLENDGSLLSVPNAFDLQGAEIQYLRRRTGMSAVRADIGYKDVLGERIAFGDDESIEFVFENGFRFPFGEATYDRVWVNSDGSLTFGEADDASVSRDLGRFLNGPPRIAPLFTDLDPSQTQGGDGIYVAQIPKRFRVTWLNVPEFDKNNPSTVQVTLYANGRILFAYGDTVGVDSAIVGVNAFPNGEVHLMDYDEELPFKPRPVAIAEEFGTESTVNDLAISRAFFQGFRDRYTHLVVWLDFDYTIPGGAFAFHQLVQNDARGLGRDVVDRTAVYGSPGKLESYVQMGSLGRYVEDPDDVFRAGLYSPLGLIGHEVGHRWLAFARFRDESGQTSEALLGRQKAHWSFKMHSAGSFDEGNWIVDNGDGTFTTTEQASTRYSELDQYLMGLRPASAVVEETFYVSSAQATDTDPPRANYTFAGTRHDVSLDDVVAVHGPRVPAFGQAPRSFRMAFVLVTDGGPPDPGSIAKLDLFRSRWMEKFQEATDNRATVKTGLFPK